MKHVCKGTVGDSFVACGESPVLYGWCSPECEVRAAFHRADLEGLLRMGAPQHEYDHEADESFEVCCVHAAIWGIDQSAAIAIVRETMRRSFTGGFTGGEDRRGEREPYASPEKCVEMWPDERLQPIAQVICSLIVAERHG